MYREIGFKEGYQMLRKAGCGWFTSAGMAFIWFIRGDKIPVDE